MKKHISLLFILLSVSAHAQFRGQEPRTPSVEEHQIQRSSSSVFGFFDPSRFSMSHSVSMGYLSMGREGLGYSAYTNSMKYQISDPLSVRADITMMYSPVGSLSAKLNNTFSGIFLERARIDYRPSKEFGVSLQFQQMPAYSSPWNNAFGYDGLGYRRAISDPWDESR
ncbi:MAG: hypothetical protein HY962_04555 [Ignavibacteriae bacterium]|nr:hypothetical protein [Ignavibacteriota bacterium]